VAADERLRDAARADRCLERRHPRLQFPDSLTQVGRHGTLTEAVGWAFDAVLEILALLGDLLDLLALFDAVLEILAVLGDLLGFLALLPVLNAVLEILALLGDLLDLLALFDEVLLVLVVLDHRLGALDLKRRRYCRAGGRDGGEGHTGGLARVRVRVWSRARIEGRVARGARVGIASVPAVAIQLEVAPAVGL